MLTLHIQLIGEAILTKQDENNRTDKMVNAKASQGRHDADRYMKSLKSLSKVAALTGSRKHFATRFIMTQRRIETQSLQKSIYVSQDVTQS